MKPVLRLNLWKRDSRLSGKRHCRSFIGGLLIEEKIILELKTVDKIMPIHEAQLLSYLKLSGCKLGFLINFHSFMLKDGIRRIVNKL